MGGKVSYSDIRADCRHGTIWYEAGIGLQILHTPLVLIGAITLMASNAVVQVFRFAQAEQTSKRCCDNGSVTTGFGTVWFKIQFNEQLLGIKVSWFPDMSWGIRGLCKYKKSVRPGQPSPMSDSGSS